MTLNKVDMKLQSDTSSFLFHSNLAFDTFRHVGKLGHLGCKGVNEQKVFPEVPKSNFECLRRFAEISL